MKEQLLLFSGGLDSCVLLKILLEKFKNPLTVLFINYNKFGYSHFKRKTFSIQNKKVKNIIKYFKKNYRSFNFRQIDFGFKNSYLDNFPYFHNDHHAVFFASYYLLNSNKKINDVWIGHFLYNDLSSIQRHKQVNNWFFDNSLEKILNIFNLIKIEKIKLNLKIPSLIKDKNFYFYSKHEAFNYLEDELKSFVRSCEGDTNFCKECDKCKEYFFYKI